MTRFLLASALFAFAGAASAQNASGAAQPRPANTIQAEAEADAKVDRFCISDTGTRIKKRAERVGSDKSQKDCVAAGGRVYTRGDIQSTGRTDLADALRALDPSIY